MNYAKNKTALIACQIFRTMRIPTKVVEYITKNVKKKEKGRSKMNYYKITKEVLLKTPQDVKSFCYAMSAFPRCVSIKVNHGSYTVDGRSILGMFSLNLSEPVSVVFEGSESLDSDKITKAISPWEVRQ